MKKASDFFGTLLLLVTLFCVICITMGACASNSFQGTYQNIIYDEKYVFEQGEHNTGTYEYFYNGEQFFEDDDMMWSIQGDVLILTQEYGEVYFKICDGCLIAIEDKYSEVDMFEFTAPKGETFDWTYSESSDGSKYEFHKDGTFTYGRYEEFYGEESEDGDSVSCYEDYVQYNGVYSVDNNIIYLEWESTPNENNYEFKNQARFFIYNGTHITDAYYVYVKK